jgi:hypothetical protein
MPMAVRFLNLVFFFCASTSFASNQMNVAVGTSVPASEQNLILPHGPSRSSGGERFLVKFAGAKTITAIKISAFSTARNGKALIHNATGTNGTKKVALEGLYKFGAQALGNPTNYNGKNMLTDSSSVEISPNQAFTQIEITVEGFSNDDSSVLLQITSDGELAVEDFLVTRNGPRSNESVGGLIDESRYAKFTASELQALMKQAKTPAAAALDGKTFLCTGYSKLNPIRLNYKTRTFKMAADGTLQSESDLEGATQIWSLTAQGQVRTMENVNGCGQYLSYQIVRSIGTGSLISEVVTHQEDYVKLCVSAGYDENAVRTVESNSTFPSVVDAKYSAGSYEFCQAQ